MVLLLLLALTTDNPEVALGESVAALVVDSKLLTVGLTGLKPYVLKALLGSGDADGLGQSLLAQASGLCRLRLAIRV